MSTVKIINAFQKLSTTNLGFCKLCLRDEIERRLVYPSAVFSLMTAMNLEVFEDLTVCYFCEARAASAYSFIKVINFAINANMLFCEMKNQDKKKIVEDFLTGVSSDIDKEEKQPLYIAAADCEALLDDIVRRTALVNTGTLLIDTEKTWDPRKLGKQKDAANLTQTNIETVVIDDDEELDPLAGTEIVIDCDNETQTDVASNAAEDVSRKIRAEIRRPVISVVPEAQLMVPKDQTITPLMLPPREYTDNDMFMLTYSLNANGEISISQSENIDQDISANSNRLVFNPGVSQPVVPSNLVANSIQFAMDSSGSSNNSRIPYLTLNAEVNTLSDSSGSDFIRSVVKERGAGESNGRENGVMGMVEGQREVVKEPVRKKGMIDFEDKIPMDVISFEEPRNIGKQKDAANPTQADIETVVIDDDEEKDLLAGTDMVIDSVNETQTDAASNAAKDASQKNAAEIRKPVNSVEPKQKSMELKEQTITPLMLPSREYTNDVMFMLNANGEISITHSENIGQDISANSNRLVFNPGVSQPVVPWIPVTPVDPSLPQCNWVSNSVPFAIDSSNSSNNSRIPYLILNAEVNTLSDSADSEFTHSVLKDRVGGESNGRENSAMGMVEGQCEVVKEPVRKDGMIDFEDKIPMDVISFVDKSDSHLLSYNKDLHLAMRQSNHSNQWTGSFPVASIATQTTQRRQYGFEPRTYPGKRGKLLEGPIK